MLQHVVVVVVVVCHVFSTQIGQAEKTKQVKHRISEMMHENGRRQNEEKKYMRVLSASPCHDKNHTSMLGIILNIKLLIRKTYQHSWGTEHVTEWVIYQVEESSCIQVSIPHNLGREESLARSTPK
jgi:hypothetical protein